MARHRDVAEYGQGTRHNLGQPLRYTLNRIDVEPVQRTDVAGAALFDHLHAHHHAVQQPDVYDFGLTVSALPKTDGSGSDSRR